MRGMLLSSKVDLDMFLMMRLRIRSQVWRMYFRSCSEEKFRVRYFMNSF